MHNWFTKERKNECYLVDMAGTRNVRNIPSALLIVPQLCTVPNSKVFSVSQFRIHYSWATLYNHRIPYFDSIFRVQIISQLFVRPSFMNEMNEKPSIQMCGPMWVMWLPQHHWNWTFEKHAPVNHILNICSVWLCATLFHRRGCYAFHQQITGLSSQSPQK